MIMEAVAVKAAKASKEQEKAKQREEFKHDKDGLSKLREIAGG